MATQGIEQVTENAIRAVARDCGSLSMECSDVSGYVQGVATRIGEHMKMLDQLEEVTTRLMGDQARVSDSTDEARLLSEQAKAKLDTARSDFDKLKSNLKSLNTLAELADKNVDLKQHDVDRKTKLVSSQAGSQADLDTAFGIGCHREAAG